MSNNGKPKIPLLFSKHFSNGNILVFEDGQAFIQWIFTERQKPFLNRKIPWFLCFFMADLCQKHMKTPHPTCISCKLLKAVTGDLPEFTPILIRQIWDIQPKTKVHEIAFRHCLSLAELMS